ncbi:MAG: T9SS type A sorting domain-containing protein [Bacteroidales bacterium]|nr:T9SS type A sorting domain-containing protein [Bacteroidales bacterium]
MRHKRLKMCAILLLGLGLTGLQAQENMNATGGNAAGSGGSASYSVGQVVYTTNTGTTGSVAQGVQQAFEISVVGIEEANGIQLSVAAYPNPSTDYLTLEVKDFEPSTLSFQLFDMQGKLLQSQQLTNSQTRIVMSELVPAIYFVKVIEGDREVKTFKIVKR